MDLDDDELKATKNKFYKDEFGIYYTDTNDKKDYSEINKKSYQAISKGVYFDDVIKYIKILQNIYEHCDMLDIDEFIEITNYMIDREMLIKELKDEINEMWSHIPRLD